MSNLMIFGADQIRGSIVTSRYSDKLMIVMRIASIIRLLSEIFILQDIFFVFHVSLIFLSIVLFIVGWKYYIHKDAYDSVVTTCFPVYRNAFKTWRQCSRGAERMPMNILPSQTEEITRDHKLFQFLDFAMVDNHGKFNKRIVDDVKSFQSGIFIFILVLPYWLIYAQIYSNFPKQANYMALTGLTQVSHANRIMAIIENLVVISKIREI